jgi:hypothetical protein
MRQYTLYDYVPDERNPPVIRKFQGADDAAALKEAGTIGPARTVEIWEAGRLVGRVGEQAGPRNKTKKS